MQRTIAALLIAASTGALACTSPATGTLEDMMMQAIWTEHVGTIATDRRAIIHIELPALNVTGFDCLTWNVELILPPGFQMRFGNDGARGPTSYTGLAASEHRTFSVDMPGRDHQDSVEILRGWLRVQVRNPLDSAGVYLARADGSPLWLYPIRFQVAGR